MLTPFGYHHAACVHAVPDGAIVHNTDTHLVVEHPSFRTPRRIRRCGIPLSGRTVPRTPVETRSSGFDDDDSGVNGDGWQVGVVVAGCTPIPHSLLFRLPQAYTEQKVAGKITRMTARWPVPPEPAEEAQTLFTFPGLQNINWVPPNPHPGKPFDIIQPVLQYGSSSAGAFDAWSIASWYVTLGSDVVFSPLKKIAAGDQLFGNMTRVRRGIPASVRRVLDTCCGRGLRLFFVWCVVWCGGHSQTGGDSWFINTVDETSGITSGFTVTRSILTSQPWAYVALEVYDVETCAQFPAAGTKMPYTQLELEVGGVPQQFDWTIGTAGQKPPTCGASIDIKSPTDVVITW